MTEGVIVAIVTVIGGGLIKGIFDLVGQSKSSSSKIDTLLADVESVKQAVEETKQVATLNRDGLRYIQRYRLQHDMQRAIMEGHTTTQQLNEVSILYDSYRDLGGNGAVEALYQRFIKLEIKED